jgi:ATP-dependent Zn protease
MSDISDTNSERLATAFHEAGHGVMALILGRTIEKVSVVRNSIRLGVVQLGKGRSGRKQDFYEHEALILLAGLVSEHKHTGVYNWAGAQQDLRGLRRLSLARVATEQDAEKLERKLLDKAAYLLEQDLNWLCVERMAQELMLRSIISGRSARHLFEEINKKK